MLNLAYSAQWTGSVSCEHFLAKSFREPVDRVSECNRQDQFQFLLRNSISIRQVASCASGSRSTDMRLPVRIKSQSGHCRLGICCKAQSNRGQRVQAAAFTKGVGEHRCCSDSRASRPKLHPSQAVSLTLWNTAGIAAGHEGSQTTSQSIQRGSSARLQKRCRAVPAGFGAAEETPSDVQS